MPDTEIIVVAHPSPVFVDSTGRRRRLLKRVAYGFGALCMVYGGLISVSLAGGPVSSSALLPLPRPVGGDDEDEHLVMPRPSPPSEPPAPRPTGQPILEVFPRRGAPVTRTSTASPVAPRSAPATLARTPSARPVKAKPPAGRTAKPVE